MQSIDAAATMVAIAGIKKPKSFQGKNILPLVYNKDEAVRDYVFTENLWATQFGNPRCEAVQDKSGNTLGIIRTKHFRHLKISSCPNY